eukprot:Sspe_Gene.110883::Locus_92006_Transcript_1_3_Confidence_0.375_Length_1085::g.110883::m.110883
MPARGAFLSPGATTKDRRPPSWTEQSLLRTPPLGLPSPLPISFSPSSLPLPLCSPIPDVLRRAAQVVRSACPAHDYESLPPSFLSSLTLPPALPKSGTLAYLVSGGIPLP